MFHIRIRINSEWQGSLIDEEIGASLLESVRFYHDRDVWFCRLFLLMPDHIHALLSFTPTKSMSRIIGEWKTYHRKASKIGWQSNYFDHRIRSDEELELKRAYILMNPVVKGLCSSPGDWMWKFKGS